LEQRISYIGRDFWRVGAEGRTGTSGDPDVLIFSTVWIT
jgi:hypothetical protein